MQLWIVPMVKSSLWMRWGPLLCLPSPSQLSEGTASSHGSSQRLQRPEYPQGQHHRPPAAHAPETTHWALFPPELGTVGELTLRHSYIHVERLPGNMLWSSSTPWQAEQLPTRGERYPLPPSPLCNIEMRFVLEFTFAVVTLMHRRLAYPHLLSLLLLFSTSPPPCLLSQAPEHLCTCFKGCRWNRLLHHLVSLFLVAWHLAKIKPPQVVTLLCTREKAQKVQTKATILVTSRVPVGKDLWTPAMRWKSRRSLFAPKMRIHGLCICS